MKKTAKKKWNKFYVNWIIRNQMIFYSYLLAGTAFVLILMCNINIDIMLTIPCKYEDNKLVIQGGKDITFRQGQTVYFYINKNEKVYTVPVGEHGSIGGKTYVVFSADSLDKAVEGFLEVSDGKENLLFAVLK